MYTTCFRCRSLSRECLKHLVGTNDHMVQCLTITIKTLTSEHPRICFFHVIASRIDLSIWRTLRKTCNLHNRFKFSHMNFHEVGLHTYAVDDSDGLGRLGACPCPPGSPARQKSIKSLVVLIAIFAVMHNIIMYS